MQQYKHKHKKITNTLQKSDAPWYFKEYLTE